MLLYEGQLREYDYNIEVHRKHHKQKPGVSATTYYSNSIMTFDIETTSSWLENGKVIGYERGLDAEYWNNLEPLALCYLWQFSIDGTVYYGRELRDFLKLLSDIPKNLHCIIWVHNLHFEFAFLQNILTWQSVFARAPHKPMKCVPNEFPQIEFRCTYFLTRLSLDAWGKQIGVLKATGDLDYEVVRTPLTKLSEKELNYGSQDCLVVEAGIKEYLKKYKKQRDIPLTQTGTVRLEVKNLLMSDEKYSWYIKKLVPRDSDEYQRLRSIFAGGYTHANRFWAGQVIKGVIEHYDFASSYPTVMVAEKFPCRKWAYIGTRLPVDYFDDFAYIIHLKFTNIRSISLNTYIQASKANTVHGSYDNGRVMRADSLEMWITEQDYITITNNYRWDEMEILDVYESKKEYLPKAFVEYILTLYKNKTELKDVEGKEDLYMQSKQYINSLYGMSVTAIVQGDVALKGDEWTIIPITKEYVDKKLDNLRYPNPREKRYFLSYSWGCWVTAYARRNLWKCIESADKDVIYCDTDSIFVLGKHDFSWYNKDITDKLYTACEEQGLDFQMTRPKTIKGKQKPLGVFDKEEDCCEFITLGAKRYVERRVNDNKLHLTVSGINKEAVELLNNDIENFADGFDFDKDADCVSKRLCTYVDSMPTVQYPDGYISTYTHGINLRRNGYKLSMTDEYKDLLEFMQMTVDDLPEEFIVKMRGVWIDGEQDKVL